jgi:hypothetical protein
MKRALVLIHRLLDLPSMVAARKMFVLVCTRLRLSPRSWFI